jgi:hypothetical protein
MAPIQYSLIYEHSYWRDADFIEADRDKWHDLAFAFEDILERTPELHPVVRADGGRILPTFEHFEQLPSLFVLYEILEPAPDGKVLLRRVVKEADVRAGVFRHLDPDEDDRFLEPSE